MKPVYAPPCTRCNHPYLEGRDGVCMTCLRLERKRKNGSQTRTSIRADGIHPTSHPRRPHGRSRRRRPMFCECGRPAVTVVLVTLGAEDYTYQVRMPLCAQCLQLEKEMWK
jgi:hypothetical protein